MNYQHVQPGRFIFRRNRFVAEVEINGRQEIVHVKNTGRCRELLLPGAEVWLARSDNPARKTLYDLIAVRKVREDGTALLINMDSQAPNSAAFEWLPRSGLFSPEARFKRESTYAHSRFDLFVEDGERQIFIEVKGVTLEKEGTALFPDAPTERGVKHLNELVCAVRDGFEAWVLFVVQMKEISSFSPNDAMHPAFGEALRRAASAGVKILVMDCCITPESMTIDQPVRLQL